MKTRDWTLLSIIVIAVVGVILIDIKRDSSRTTRHLTEQGWRRDAMHQACGVAAFPVDTELEQTRATCEFISEDQTKETCKKEREAWLSLQAPDDDDSYRHCIMQVNQAVAKKFASLYPQLTR